LLRRGRIVGEHLDLTREKREPGQPNPKAQLFRDGSSLSEEVARMLESTRQSTKAGKTDEASRLHDRRFRRAVEDLVGALNRLRYGRWAVVDRHGQPH
jgi:hypothetical protein